MGSRLLLTDDPIQAAKLAGELDALNRERQAIEVEAVAEAEAQAMFALDRSPDLPILVTASAEWHPGIVGLISARTKERFRRPAFAFTLNPDGTATGSGRSVVGVDLGTAVRAAVESGVAIKGGGHTMAAGVTIAAADLQVFQEFISAQARRAGGPRTSRRPFRRRCDADRGRRADQPWWRLWSGQGRSDRRSRSRSSCSPHHRVVEAREVGSGGHVRVKLRGGDGSFIGGIAFRAAGQPLGETLYGGIGGPLHVAGTLSVDRWGGGEKVSLADYGCGEARIGHSCACRAA